MNIALRVLSVCVLVALVLPLSAFGEQRANGRYYYTLREVAEITQRGNLYLDVLDDAGYPLDAHMTPTRLRVIAQDMYLATGDSDWLFFEQLVVVHTRYGQS